MVGNSTYSRRDVQNKQMHYSPNLLSTLENSINSHKVITIEYDSYEKGVSIRDVEPMAIVYKERKRNLVGWCRLRNDYRSFRLDKLNCVKLKQEDFTRREDFKIEDHQDLSGPQHGEDDYDA